MLPRSSPRACSLHSALRPVRAVFTRLPAPRTQAPLGSPPRTCSRYSTPHNARAVAAPLSAPRAQSLPSSPPRARSRCPALCRVCPVQSLPRSSPRARSRRPLRAPHAQSPPHSSPRAHSRHTAPSTRARPRLQPHSTTPLRNSAPRCASPNPDPLGLLPASALPIARARPRLRVAKLSNRIESRFAPAVAAPRRVYCLCPSSKSVSARRARVALVARGSTGSGSLGGTARLPSQSAQNRFRTLARSRPDEFLAL